MPDVATLTNIPNHCQDKFGSIVTHKFQQGTNKLEGLYSFDGEFAGVERKRYDVYDAIDETTAIADITATHRDGTTVAHDMSSSLRWMSGSILREAVRYSRWDKSFMGQLENPQSTIYQSMMKAINRKNQRYLIEAFGAQVATGPKGDGTSGNLPVSFPAGQVIAVNYKDNAGIDGTGPSTTFNLSKFMRIQSQFVDNEVAGQGVESAENDKPVIILCQKDIRQMLADVKVQSKDFNDVQPLLTGQLNEWYGMRIIRVAESMLPVADGVRSIYAWVPAAIKFWQGEMFTRINELPEKEMKIQLYTAWRIASMRFLDEGIVRCDVVA